MTILDALVPIVFVVGLGWFSGAKGIVARDSSATLATFVVKFALPLSLFLAAADARPERILNGPYILALAVGLIGSWLLGLAVSRFLFRRDTAESAMQGLVCSFPNMAYCGPPVLTAAVGSSALLSVVIGNLIVTLVILPLTLVLVGSGGGLLASLRRSLLQPLVILPVAGALYALAGLPLPQLARDATDEVGRAAGGVALFTLGLILSGVEARLNREIVFNVALKNVLQALLIGGAGWLLGLRGDLWKAAFLIGVLPSATAVPTLALSRGIYAKESAATVLVSTLFAIVTISAGIAIAGLM